MLAALHYDHAAGEKVALKAAAGAQKGLDFRKAKENHKFENVHPSRAPGQFWPNRDAVRTLITTVSCVVRRGRKSGHGSP